MVIKIIIKKGILLWIRSFSEVEWVVRGYDVEDWY